jgi:hypothetical protein
MPFIQSSHHLVQRQVFDQECLRAREISLMARTLRVTRNTNRRSLPLRLGNLKPCSKQVTELVRHRNPLFLTADE